jgi:hypothetical protein
MKQTIKNLTRLASASALTITMSGIALADSAAISGTGPSSTNDITVNNTKSSSITDTSDTIVLNVNQQVAKTGDVNVDNNTTVNGAIQSGDATNNNHVATTVINQPIGGSGNGTGPTSLPVGGSGNGGSSTPIGGSGGSVLGASTGGFGLGAAATLPSVGASVPMDVSALRALYKPAAISQPATSLINHSRALSVVFLALASLASLIGAALSALYSRRQKRLIV